MNSVEQVKSEETEAPFAALIGHLSGTIASPNFPSGDRADFKRMKLDEPPPLAFHRFAVRHLPKTWQYEVKAWQAIMQGMALMVPNIHSYDKTHSFGAVLARHNYSELRLERLLAADRDIQPILVLRAVRFIAAKMSPVNWIEIASLLLTHDDEKRQSQQMRIASNYFSQQAESNKE